MRFVTNVTLVAQLLAIVLGLVTATGTAIAEGHFFSGNSALEEAIAAEVRAEKELGKVQGDIASRVGKVICSSPTAHYSCVNAHVERDAVLAAGSAIWLATQMTINDFKAREPAEGPAMMVLQLENSLYFAIPTQMAQRTGAGTEEVQAALDETGYFRQVGSYPYAETVDAYMAAVDERVRLQGLPELIARPAEWVLWAFRVGFLSAGLFLGVGIVLVMKRLIDAIRRAPSRSPAPGFAGMSPG